MAKQAKARPALGACHGSCLTMPALNTVQKRNRLVQAMKTELNLFCNLKYAALRIKAATLKAPTQKAGTCQAAAKSSIAMAEL